MPNISSENLRLQILNTNYESFEDNPMRTFHNGHVGGAYEQLFFIRNQNASKYYTNVKVTPGFKGGYKDSGEFGSSGWGIKVMYGKRRPTEQEWDMVKSGSAVIMPDIGTCEAADTFTNHPIWTRVFCPGGEPAQIKESMQLDITYYIKEVGACPDQVQILQQQEEISIGPFAVFGRSNSGDSNGAEGYFYPVYLEESKAVAIDNDSDGSQTAIQITLNEFPDIIFYMPNSQMNFAMETSGGFLIFSNGSD